MINYNEFMIRYFYEKIKVSLLLEIIKKNFFQRFKHRKYENIMQTLHRLCIVII